MKVGDSIKINKNVTNGYIFDSEYLIEGYEGRIFDIHKSMGDVFVQIEFDSISLKQMPDAYIKKLIKLDTDYACIDVYLKEVTLSAVRDTPEDVILTRKEIGSKHSFVSIIDEGDYNIWDKDPKDIKDSDEIALEPEEEGGQLKVMVSLCRVNGFLKAFNRFKKEKVVTRKRTRKRKL